MKLQVVDLKNKKVSDVELSDSIFAKKSGKGSIYEVVKMQLANKRVGSAATRNHTLVSGTTAKMYRQKGTGRARHGDQRTNIFVGGGKAFGPHPRDYSYKVPRKIRKGALAAALSEKARTGKLVIVDDFSMSAIKTKAFVEALNTLGVKTGLLILDTPNTNVERSARNVPTVKVLPWEGLNVVDVVRFEHLVVAKNALSKIEEALTI